MDRKNYDAKVVAVFDNIGSFFVDTFYNSLYLKARDLVKGGKAASITEAYRANVINYMNGIAQRPDLYIVVVRKLHEYYQKSSGFGAVVFSEFEDKVLSQFIPPEYYRDFTEKHKDNTLHEIVVRTVNELGEIALTKPILTKIIDDHMSIANVQLLQDKMMDVLITQREDYYGRFVQEINKSNGNDKVSKRLVDKLKDAFVAEKKARCKAEEDRDRATSIISQLVAKISSMEREIASLKDRPAEASPPVMDIMGSLDKDSRSVSSVRRRGRPRKSPTEQPAPTQLAQPKPPVASAQPAQLAPPSQKKGASAEPNPDDSDGEGDDPDEVYKRQREILAQRRAKGGAAPAKPAEPAEDNIEDDDSADKDDTNALNDDPGWGN